MKVSHRSGDTLHRRVYEWWLWRRAQRSIRAAFPGATTITDRRHQ